LDEDAAAEFARLEHARVTCALEKLLTPGDLIAAGPLVPAGALVAARPLIPAGPPLPAARLIPALKPVPALLVRQDASANAQL
jgi:hypothetical protein